MFSRTDILNYLRDNKTFFKIKYDVIKIGIFGSYAREEQLICQAYLSYKPTVAVFRFASQIHN